MISRYSNEIGLLVDMNNNNSLIEFEDNSITLFRYIAAFQVLLNHATHLDIEIPEWLSFPFRLFQGVPLFFGISGFLIWKSLEKNETFIKYGKRRFKRLYPELWIAVIFSVASIVVIYKDNIDWPMMGAFVVGQASVFQFWTPDFLRGYGVGTPNGSLWTITIFVQFYVVIYFIYKWIKDKPLKVWIAIFITSVVVDITYPFVGGVLPEVAYKLYGQSIFPFFYLFFLGCMIQKYFDKIILLLKRYWIIFLLLDAIFLGLDVDLPGRFGPLRTICLVITTIGLAYAVRVKIKVDISYEIYLIHMVIINIFVQIGFVGRISNFIIVIIISIAVSILLKRLIDLILNRKNLYIKRNL